MRNSSGCGDSTDRRVRNASERTCTPVINIIDLMRADEGTSAQRNLESMNVITAGVAHDLTNVLCGVLAEAEVLELDLPVGAESPQGLQRIKAGAMLAIEIVRELMPRQGQPKRAEALDLSGLVEEVLVARL